MMLACDFLKEPIEFYEGIINVIVIENQKLFRRTVSDFIEHAEKGGEKFVLSEKFEPMEFSKKAAVVSDLFGMDFSSKKISGKINQHICENFSEDEDIYEAIRILNKIGFKAISNADFELVFSEINGLENIVKFFDFKIDDEGMELPEKVIEYMRLQRSFFGKEIFVFVNLKSCFSEEETREFYRYIAYDKFKVILIESFQRGIPQSREKTIIIDEDLCEIS